MTTGIRRFLTEIRTARTEYATRQLALAAGWESERNTLCAIGMGKTFQAENLALAAAWARLKAAILGGVEVP